MEVRVVVLSLSRLVVVPPTVSDAHLILPAPVIVAALLLFAAFCRVIPPVTVRVIPELTVKVALLLVKVIEFTVVSAVTVTEALDPIVTSSSEAGTPLGFQLLALPQVLPSPSPSHVLEIPSSGFQIKLPSLEMRVDWAKSMWVEVHIRSVPWAAERVPYTLI